MNIRVISFCMRAIAMNIWPTATNRHAGPAQVAMVLAAIATMRPKPAYRAVRACNGRSAVAVRSEPSTLTIAAEAMPIRA
jgi:hypothetical protein